MSSTESQTMATNVPANPSLPRVAITYCTQCKWLLRAAYFGQELLSTFGTSVGEVALIPATGGIFTVYLTYKPPTSDAEATEGGEVNVQEVLLWDRKAEGGFPETKILKQRLRNHIEPGKGLGHSDKPSNKIGGVEGGAASTAPVEEKTDIPAVAGDAKEKECEDCK